MKILTDKLSQLSIGDKWFYALVVIFLPLMTYSWSTDKFFLANLLENRFNLHHTFKIEYIYTEILFWTISITIAQLYRYHSNIMNVYDDIKIGTAKRRFQIFHYIAQISLSVFIFLSFLLILSIGFISFYKWDIFSDYGVQISEITSKYLPMLNLKYLLVYFLFIDIILLLIKANFRSSDVCSDEDRNKHTISIKDQIVDIPITLLFILAENGFHWLASMDAPQYAMGNKSGYGFKDVVPLAVILFLQYVYVVSDILRRRTDRAV